MVENSEKNTRWWDIMAAIFLVFAMLTAASRLVATGWTRDLSIVQTLSFLGIMAGFALGYSRFSPITVFLFSTAYGAFAVPWQLGNLLREDLPWLERVSVLLNRLGVIFYQIFHHEELFDSLLFLVIMGVLYWALAIHAGYSMVRYGKSWGAVLPAGLSIFIIHLFDPLVFRRGLYLAAFFFFALIYVARMIYIHNRNLWQANRTALPPQLGFNYLRFAIVAVLLIVLFAWTIPGLANAAPAAQKAWMPVSNLWNKARQEFKNLFAPLRSNVAAVTTVYGETAALGLGNILSDRQVFSVQVPGDIAPGIRLYWRARVYDIYDFGRWTSSISESNPFDPQRTDLRSPIYSGRWLGSFEITTSTNMETIFSPAVPLWVDRPGHIEYIILANGTVDISAFKPDPPLEMGQTYHAQSAVNYATIEQLKSAGTEYPEWVTERFLQLPDSITRRTIDLANQLTANQPTVYDKVLAINSYLRENYEYVKTLESEPPSGREPIDWFLFDYRKGFCNYFSTAEVLLLRAAGIPARWAIGYAQGDLMEGDRTGGRPSQERITYLVRQKDAHAWPEVYFTGIGWVEFEPTTSQPDITRPPGGAEKGNLDPLLNRSELLSRQEMERNLAELLSQRGMIPNEAVNGANRSYMVYWILLSLIAAGSFLLVSWRAGWLKIASRGGMLFIKWRNRRPFIIQPVVLMLESSMLKIGLTPPQFMQHMAKRALLPPISKAYLQINFALERLDAAPHPNETPSERAIRLGKLIPGTEKAAERLVREYHLATFGQKSANSVVAWSSAMEIRNLTSKAGILRKFQRK